MVRLVSLLLFLVFVDDDSCAYRLHLGAPMAWVTNVLLVPSPIKIRPFDLIMLVILIMGSSQARAKAPLVAPSGSPSATVSTSGQDSPATTGNGNTVTYGSGLSVPNPIPEKK